MDILHVIALPLQPLVEKRAIGLEVLGIARIDDLEIAVRIRQADCIQFLAHIILATDNQRLAQSGSRIGHRRAQDTHIIPFCKYHPRLRFLRAIEQPVQHAGRGIKPGAQIGLILFKIHNRFARNSGINPRLRNGGWNCIDQARVEGRRNDVVPPKGQFAPIGHRNLVGDILARELGKSLRTGNFHGIIDGPCPNIQRPSEEIGETKHVIDLIWVI